MSIFTSTKRVTAEADSLQLQPRRDPIVSVSHECAQGRVLSAEASAELILILTFAFKGMGHDSLFVLQTGDLLLGYLDNGYPVTLLAKAIVLALGYDAMMYWKRALYCG
ncbi:hypothetical protein CEP53_006702 [Fusarium sp. AF-6]|nr:hypothetical protein CEP53_006702 [Fusarium sp. AF-6]